eukprot:TRINITY_DN6158_c0_g1_i1.p1 TRINITY_DN6158_c0_g1~~TRINITY_DN6158_c0_g1_i1.p1  ORF type:complete len:1162 (+),score=218.29 TRINITY_DN6158_c0_g1_i1:299-3487(+)
MHGPTLIASGADLDDRPPINFKWPIEVEITTRFVLKYVPRGSSASSVSLPVKIPNEALQVALWIYRSGMARFPRSAYLLVSYSSFLQCFTSQDSLSFSLVEQAKEVRPALDMRFLIYTAEHHRMHKRQSELLAQTGEGAMDLLSYLEFHNNLHLAKSNHLATLDLVKDFWRTLLKAQSRDDLLLLAKLPEISHAIMVAEEKANNSYAWLLKHYQNSTQVLRAYASFLEDVMHDGSGSSKILAKAARIEKKMERQRHRELRLKAKQQLAEQQQPISARGEMGADNQQQHHHMGSGAGINGGADGHVGGDSTNAASSSSSSTTTGGVGVHAYMKVHSQHSAVLTIDTKGIIATINRMGCKLLGYKQEELIGKNVNILMPSPYAEQHDLYLQRYLHTGVSHILGRSRPLEALHKDGTLISIMLSVTKIKLGDQIMFAGILVAMDDDAMAKLTLDPSGKILTANKTAATMLGYTNKELTHHNVNVKDLLSAEWVDKYPDTSAYFRSYDAETSPAGMMKALRNINVKKKNGGLFAGSLRIKILDSNKPETAPTTHVSGDEELHNGAVLYSLSISKVEGENAIVTIDTTGIIRSCNRSACLMFGYYQGADLVGRNISALMPLPYSAYHDTYMKNYDPKKPSNIVGKWRRVEGLHSDGSVFSMHLHVNRSTDTDGRPLLFGKMRRVSAIESRERETTIRATSYGTMLSVEGEDQLRDILGYTAADVVGHNLKMLMHRTLASKHDGYLRRFREHPDQPHLVDQGPRSVEGQHKDGRIIPISLTLSTEKTRDKDMILVGKIAGVTHRDAIITINKMGTILSCNDYSIPIFGHSRPDLVGQPLSIIIPDVHQAPALSSSTSSSSSDSPLTSPKPTNWINTSQPHLFYLPRSPSQIMREAQQEQQNNSNNNNNNNSNDHSSSSSSSTSLSSMVGAKLLSMKVENDNSGHKASSSSSTPAASTSGLKVLVGKRILASGKHKDGTNFPVTLEMAPAKNPKEKSFVVKIERVAGSHYLPHYDSNSNLHNKNKKKSESRLDRDGGIGGGVESKVRGAGGGGEGEVASRGGRAGQAGR